MEEQHVLYENLNYFSNLNDMRQAGMLCDVTIKVEDREIRAHKVILAANLKYFATMFMNSFQECKQDVITMENVEGSDLEALINYAYTGEIVLTDSNAVGLLEVANYLSEDSVRKACIDFLEKHLEQEQACQIYKVANAIECFSLKHKAKRIILWKFQKCSQTTGYLNLDVKSLEDILSSVNFVGSEQILLESLVRWVAYDAENRRTHVDDLLNTIHFTEWPAGRLSKYLHSNPQNQDNSGIIEDIKIFYNNKIQEMKRHSRRWRQYLIVIDVIQDRNQQCHIQFYDLVKKKWSRPWEFTICNSGIKDVKAVVLKNKLYSFIRAKMSHESHLRVFNPTTKQCEVLTFDRRLLDGIAMCACTRYLYFCGGCIRALPMIALDQVLKYDPETNSFESLPPMGTKRTYAAAIIYQGCLYVLGGYDGSHYLSSVEKYNPETKRWTVLPSMRETRRFHAVAVLNEKLYVCGGESRRSVEVYEPSTNSWQHVAEMTGSRDNFLAVTHEDKLLAVKGNLVRTIEVYDSRKNQWDTDFQMAFGLQMGFPAGGVISSRYITDADFHFGQWNQDQNIVLIIKND